MEEVSCIRPIIYPVYVQCYLPIIIAFIMDYCLGTILESTHGIKIKLGAYIDIN